MNDKSYEPIPLPDRMDLGEGAMRDRANRYLDHIRRRHSVRIPIGRCQET